MTLVETKNQQSAVINQKSSIQKRKSKIENRKSEIVRRPRRLRATPALRAMVRETELNARDFIYPLFVRHGEGRSEIRSMPGVYQLSVPEAVREAEKASALGVPAVILFGIPAEKDPIGLENFAEDGIVQQAIRAIKRAIPEMVVVTDVCLCEYTDHGHCGVLNTRTPTSYHPRSGPDVGIPKSGDFGLLRPNLPEGYVLNDETLDILAKVAVSHAECGADIVAPSGMMDGMVAAIRGALDEHGFEHLPILSYAVKYASSFYGPFREAAEGAPKFGDRKSHQMDPANVREALKEAALDVDEGADMLMVKPALAYLDVIRVVKDAYPEIPLAAYNVSGEYAMVKAAAANGWIDEAKVTLETLTAMKRAGADLILTYHALDAAKWLK
ncbi:MAG: porphobilinogen synthase [Chloroflexota bacterium]